MEENFSMEWNIFGMEWKWNGRKLPVWNMEKSSSIPYHALVADLDRFDLFLFFFILRMTICPVVNFDFLHRHENSYLLFHPRFRLILFIFLVFKLIVILFWC